MAASYGDWEPVIGLEVHAQLLTRTKLFCGCETSFGDPPNVHTCPVCLGLPGALPVLNERAVRLAVSAALALGLSIAERSVFARKNYFYPDLPKGYQISQYEAPFSHSGKLEIEVDGKTTVARILRIHMEEDAGKNVHDGTRSVVDLNRAGTPLIEIVGEPDLRSPAEAAEYLKKLREVLMAIGVNDGNLEQGSFRCDANVSIRPRGETKLGVRTELKNINSFRFVEEAIDIEIRRQIVVLESKGKLTQQTRGYSAEKKETYLLRDKENDAGYRYFPDPDLPEVQLTAQYVEQIRASLPELPEARRRRYEGLGLTPYAAGVLTGHPKISAFFDDCVAAARGRGDDALIVKLANFAQTEVLSGVTTRGLEATFPVSAEQLVELLALVQKGSISGKQAKEVYAKMAGTPKMPGDIVAAEGLAVMGDEAELERIAKELVDANPKQVTQYRSGKKNILGFFVGQIMKATKGSADPAVVNRVLEKLLAEGT